MFEKLGDKVADKAASLWKERGRPRDDDKFKLCICDALRAFVIEPSAKNVADIGRILGKRGAKKKAASRKINRQRIESSVGSPTGKTAPQTPRRMRKKNNREPFLPFPMIVRV